MSLVEVKKDFSQRELMWFGPLFTLFVGVLVYLFIWSNFSPTVSYVIGAVAAAIVVVYYLAPPLQRPIYMGWMYSVLPIGFVVSHVLLALIYYLVVTPIGLIMKVVGYDPLHRKFDQAASTYWIERESNTDPQRYFQQY